MKKSIQRQKLALVKAIFEKIEDYFTGDVDVELADLILRNVESIESELSLIDKNPALKEPDEFEKYDIERINLVKKYAEKDDNGEIVIIPNTNDAMMSEESAVEFKKELETLKVAYADLMKKVEEINVKRDDFMRGDVEIEISPIPKALLGKIKSEGKPSGYALTVMSAIRPFLAD